MESVKKVNSQTQSNSAQKEKAAPKADLTVKAAETVVGKKRQSQSISKVKQKIQKRQLKRRAPKRRSQRYLSLRKKVNRQKSFKLKEAVEAVKELASARFDETIELHLRLKVKKGEPAFREMIEFPSGLVKKPRVAIFNDAKLAEIKQGRIDFDILLAQPSQMAQVAQVAKILGPKGLMPNPKLGTVTDQPNQVKERLEGGMREIRADSLGNLHLAVGKASWEEEKLLTNIQAVLARVARPKIEAAILCSTMGPSVKISL